MNFLIKKVRTVNGTFGHGWSIKNLADETPGEMVRASSHHYFCELDVVIVLELPQRRFLQECLWRIT